MLGAFPGDPSSSLFPAGVQQVLILIGQLGLVLFMFTVGWDLDLKLIGRRRGAAAAVSITSITVPFALGLALAPHLHAAHQSVAGTSVVAMMKLRHQENSRPPRLKAPLIGSGIDL